MKKFFFCVSLVLTGLMTSCVDKYEEVDAESKPSWLGNSIYAELKNPENNAKLTGTFTTYLRLVDDLGYAETLNRTGSKTLFPANDEAFARFFSSNEWGVTSYEQLSEAQKKLLLYSSMLDNAMLIGMLPNVPNTSGEPSRGYGLKHVTNVSITDSIQHIASGADMPQNNSHWDKFRNKGIDIVSDATTPMMVHLTREYMITNGIKTVGDDSDFAILTGTPYAEGSAYIFNDRVISSDITCQNGYIHQVEDVLVPPGNMAQVLRQHSKMHLFSRFLDYFSIPVYDESTTRNYNDWAMANGKPQKDSIYQWSYFSVRSNKSGEKENISLNQDANGNPIPGTQILSYDPGWNQYVRKFSTNSTMDRTLTDMGAFFVPEDEAVADYFVSGRGAYLIDIYGDKPNTRENLEENLDSLHSKNPGVLTKFVRNLMKASFSASVPSRFGSVINDASEVMGLETSMIKKKDDGKYDITIANNGAVYLLDRVIAPDELQSVMAPATVYPDMKVMDWAVEDGVATGDYLGVDFKYYLLAMKANYAFFIPEDNAFDLYYVDPTSLGHVDPTDPTKTRPDVIHFFYDASTKPELKCERFYFDPVTGEVDTSTPRATTITQCKTQMVDILNYHTLVLNSGEEIGSRHFYQTKHGGTVYVDGNVVGGRVTSGLQYEGDARFPAPVIKTKDQMKNGWTYRIDRVIQPPHTSVFATLNQDAEYTRRNEVNPNSDFSLFLQACMGFEASSLLTWANIPDTAEVKGMPSPQDAFTVFTRNYKLGTTSIGDACLDYNVKMFNTYNYTLFAPDNAAMQRAYAEGLPKWEDVQALFHKYYPADESEPVGGDEAADKAAAEKMIRAIRNFVRYHFMTNAVYADLTVDGGRVQTLSSDNTGVAREARISGGGNSLTVTDAKGHSVTVNAGDGSRLVNKMTRDYWFSTSKTSASAIETSSFCAVHQISEPLYPNDSGNLSSED